MARQPATVTTMASAPASVMNVSRRLADRGEDGTGFCEGRVPSLINPWMIVRGVISCRRPKLHPHSSKFPGSPLLHLRYGYRRRVPSAVLAADAAGPGRDPDAASRVRMDAVWNGGDHGGTAVGGGAEIGAGGTSGLVRDVGARGDRPDLHLQGLQRSLRIHGPRRSG